MDIDADDVEKQVELAFKNVELMLQHAGLKGWEDVYLQRTYHTDIDSSFENCDGEVEEILSESCTGVDCNRGREAWRSQDGD